ncbi:MAG: VWA domain-containing protein, partial [Ilumatobacter sp.]|nr:VWA domain-containing protein [Ilumatobacter sp.]
MTTLLRFADPAYLLLLLLVPFLVYWYVTRGRQVAALRYSSIAPIKRADGRRRGRFRHALFGLRAVALTAFVLAFARPQTGITAENVTTQGIDIVLALDLSSSMLAEDLQPNRIEAAKQVAADFISGRRNDRIGLVVFAGDAFTQAPLTLDYDVVTTLLGELEVGIIDDGTAIGMGLATAVKRLQGSDADSKVIILVTDGRN